LILERRLIPGAKSLWDQDLIDTLVIAQAGAFHGQVRTGLGSHELVHLDRWLADLYQHVGQEQTTRVQLCEPTLDLTVQMDRQGNICMDVEISSAPGVRLRFTIDADQSYVPGWRRQIQAALEWFPAPA